MVSRSKSKKDSNEIKETPKKRIENSWIILAKETLINNDNFDIITLPHPSNGSPAKYCLDLNGQKIYEIITFSEPYRSWLIEDTVKSEGSLLLATPINILFLVLPRLRNQCNGRAIPIADLLSEKGFDRIVNFVSNLDTIADLKGSEDIKAYKYNEEKTLTWLENKVHKLAQKLKEKNIHVTSGAVSATYIASNANNDAVDEEFYLKYAYGIMSDYLDDYFIDLLKKRFNFKTELIECVGGKRKSEFEEIKESNKRVKHELNTTLENGKLNSIADVFKLSPMVADDKKPKVLTAKEKARQKAANGTKTISSFFIKK